MKSILNETAYSNRFKVKAKREFYIIVLINYCVQAIEAIAEQRQFYVLRSQTIRDSKTKDNVIDFLCFIEDLVIKLHNKLIDKSEVLRKSQFLKY